MKMSDLREKNERMKKQEMIERARQMMIEAYVETDNGGFNEWDQTFIDLLRDELAYHLSKEGLDILMRTIETNSDYIQRCKDF